MTQHQKIVPLSVLKEGITLTKTNFLVYLPLLALAMLCIYGANEALMSYFLQQNPEATTLDLITKSSAIIGLLLSPLEVGIMLMGLSAARGEKIKVSDIRYILPYSAKIIILAMLTMLLVQVGFMLLILPGLFLMVVLSMAPMLMCDKKQSMFVALKTSAQTLSKQWFMIFLVYIWLIVAIFLSFYTMGVALILTLPFYVNVKGIMYYRLFDSETVDTPTESTNNDEFEA